MAALITSFPRNPLTTTFSRPPDCSGLYLSVVGMIDVSTTCLPSGFNTAATAYFSPGLVCPSGYYSACHDTTGIASVTTVTCCPTYNNDVSLWCVTASTLSGIWASLYCTWTPSSGQPTSLPFTLSANGVTSTSLAGITKPGGINAFGVRMVYQTTDLSTSQTTTYRSSSITTSPSITSNQATSPTSSQPVSPSSGSPNTSSASSGLSKGGIIGLAVAIPIGLIIIAVAVFLWLKSKRKRTRNHAPITEVATQNYRADTKPQLHEAASYVRSELPGNGYTDGGAQMRPVELPASQSMPRR